MHASTIPGVDLPLPFFPFPFDVWNAPWHRLGILVGPFSDQLHNHQPTFWRRTVPFVTNSLVTRRFPRWQHHLLMLVRFLQSLLLFPLSFLFFFSCSASASAATAAVFFRSRYAFILLPLVRLVRRRRWLWRRRVDITNCTKRTRHLDAFTTCPLVLGTGERQADDRGTLFYVERHYLSCARRPHHPTKTQNIWIFHIYNLWTCDAHFLFATYHACEKC